MIFVVDNSPSVHTDNRNKDILIHVKVSTDLLNDTTITAETEYSISFTE